MATLTDILTGSEYERNDPRRRHSRAGVRASLDFFSLHDAVVSDYRRSATSFTTLRAADVRQKIAAIYNESRFCPEPLIQINPS